MMRKGILFLLGCSIIVSMFVGCTIGGDGNIVGNGKNVNNSVKLSSSWNSVEISDLSEVNVFISDEDSNLVEYTIDENLEKYLDISENNGVLIIKGTPNKRLVNKENKSIDFHIGSNKIKDIKISESAIKVEGLGEFKADEFDLEIESAAANINLNLNCSNLKISSDGASVINLQGKSDILNVKMSGASKLLAKDYKVSDATIDLEGLSEAEIYAEDNLNIVGDGAIKVTYWGEPQVSKEINGMGSVKKGND